MRHGGMGVIEDGNLKGRKFILPSEVYVEKGTFANGSSEFSLACLVHQKFIPSGGCPECAEEKAKQEQENAAIGL